MLPVPSSWCAKFLGGVIILPGGSEVLIKAALLLIETHFSPKHFTLNSIPGVFLPFISGAAAESELGLGFGEVSSSSTG